MKNKLSFNEFVKKVGFMLGDKVNINDLSFKKVDIYHLNEFLNLDEEEFVELMYKILLRRVYDEGGKRGKLDELRSGKSRTEIILDMMNSEEGQNYIGEYEFLGINYNFSFFKEELLYKNEYNEMDFNELVSFLNFKFRYKMPDNIIDLLSYSGSEFVFLLYKILLKRDPDLIGFNHHLKASYLLQDKLQKIKDFVISEEAQGNNITFYDIKGNDISKIDVNDINLFEIDYEKFESKSKDFHFNLLLRDSLFDSIVLISSYCNDFGKCFRLITEKILKESKTIIEAIYEDDVLESLKNVYIIDFFGKPLKISNYSFVDDMLRNNSYYISHKIASLKEDITNYNLMNNIIENLTTEFHKVVKFFKRVALKEDLNAFYENEKIIEESLNNLIDIVKEHEKYILNSKKISSKNTKFKRKRR